MRPILAAVAIAALAAAGCKKAERGPYNPQPPETRAGGLVVQVLRAGDADGKVPKKGDKIWVNYKGTLADGAVFDQGKHFGFYLGENNVIPCWDQGVAGMKEGEARKLTCPPALAYGDEKHEKIPPKSTLTFEIELDEVR